MKVAFATKDGVNINDHFGWATQFAIHEVDQQGHRLVGMVQVASSGDREDDKIAARIEAIAGASILYCEAIGPTAAAKVIKSRIHPIKLSEPQSIEAACEQLSQMVSTNPPPWIKRILAREGSLDA